MRENKKENFFEKRGFFISLVVIISVMVIALIMNMIVPEEIEDDTFDADVWEEAETEVSKYYDDGLNSVYNQEAQAVYSPVQSDDLKNEDVTQDESEANISNQEETKESNISVLFEKPVDGSIVKDYSVEELLYSDTMEDWRVHEGIDFSAEEGTDVKAVADGVIESVTDNGMLGTCVIISHAGDVKSLYGNLQKESASLVGTQVKTGDVIAKVGNTATLEIDELPHIHFEVLLNDEKVNPHDYLIDTVVDDE